MRLYPNLPLRKPHLEPRGRAIQPRRITLHLPHLQPVPPPAFYHLRALPPIYHYPCGAQAPRQRQYARLHCRHTHRTRARARYQLHVPHCQRAVCGNVARHNRRPILHQPEVYANLRRLIVLHSRYTAQRGVYRGCEFVLRQKRAAVLRAPRIQAEPQILLSDVRKLPLQLRQPRRREPLNPERRLAPFYVAQKHARIVPPLSGAQRVTPLIPVPPLLFQSGIVRPHRQRALPRRALRRAFQLFPVLMRPDLFLDRAGAV